MYSSVLWKKTGKWNCFNMFNLAYHSKETTSGKCFTVLSSPAPECTMKRREFITVLFNLSSVYRKTMDLTFHHPEDPFGLNEENWSGEVSSTTIQGQVSALLPSLSRSINKGPPYVKRQRDKFDYIEMLKYRQGCFLGLYINFKQLYRVSTTLVSAWEYQWQTTTLTGPSRTFSSVWRKASMRLLLMPPRRERGSVGTLLLPACWEKSLERASNTRHYSSLKIST